MKSLYILDHDLKGLEFSQFFEEEKSYETHWHDDHFMVVLTFKGEAFTLEKRRSDSRLIPNSIQIFPPNIPHTGVFLKSLSYFSFYISHTTMKKYARDLSNDYFSYPVFKKPTSFLDDNEINKIVESTGIIVDKFANIEEKKIVLTEMLSTIFMSETCKDFTKKKYWKVK